MIEYIPDDSPLNLCVRRGRVMGMAHRAETAWEFRQRNNAELSPGNFRLVNA